MKTHPKLGGQKLTLVLLLLYVLGWLRWLLIKLGLEMEKYQDLQTHLNRISDFTGNRVRMLRTTSCGRSFEGNDGVFLGGSDSDSSRRCISVLSESESTQERIWCLKK
jgi:hypothetical protein